MCDLVFDLRIVGRAKFSCSVLRLGRWRRYLSIGLLLVCDFRRTNLFLWFYVMRYVDLCIISRACKSP